MKKFLLFSISVLGFLTISGCDTNKLNIESPPTGIIQNLAQGSEVARMVKMQIMTQAFHENANNAVKSVQVSVNGNVLGSATQVTGGLKPTFTYVWNTMNGYPDGTYNVQAQIEDTNGSKGLTDVYTVKLENGSNDGPQVTFTNIANGEELIGTKTIETEIMAGQPAVKQVVLLVDGVAVATDNLAPYSFSINPASYTTGDHTLQAKSVGTDGKIRLSSSVNVKVTGGI